MAKILSFETVIGRSISFRAEKIVALQERHDGTDIYLEDGSTYAVRCPIEKAIKACRAGFLASRLSTGEWFGVDSRQVILTAKLSDETCSIQFGKTIKVFRVPHQDLDRIWFDALQDVESSTYENIPSEEIDGAEAG